MYKCSYCPQNKVDMNHMEDEHQQPTQSEEQPTNWDLMEVLKIYKLLQRMKNK